MIEFSTGRAVSRGKLSQDDQSALLDRIRFSTDLAEFAECDLVMEAVPEHLDLKREVFAALDTVVKPDAVLATNTSSLSVTEISVATHNPRRVVGLHFFNPAPVLKFVEVIRTVVTEDDVVDDVVALAARIGKKPVVVGDRAGFIANALLFGYLNHAVVDVRVAVRDPRGHRRRDDARLRSADGSAGPDGPHRARHRLRDPQHDVQAGPRPAARAEPAAQADGHGGPQGPQERARLLHLRRARLVAGRAGRGHAAGRGRPHVGLRAISSVGVVGSGTMATGIVEVIAKAGYDVLAVARSEEKGAAVLAAVGRSLAKAVGRGKLEQADADAALARVRTTTALQDLAPVDLVVEAVVEDLAVKRALFADLDAICRPGAVLATTTSSLPVVECAAATNRPADVVGLHFFNPAPVMKLVEVVSTVSTADDVVATAVDLCRRLGKHPVTCADRAGFIVNALLFPYLNDAVKMLEAHYATADDIDTAMKTGCGYPMGPFELLDVVGLDVSLAIERELYLEFRERGYAPAPLLEHLVTAGYLGRKAGRGFRQYA